jgi:outer membrane immunogenic protein
MRFLKAALLMVFLAAPWVVQGQAIANNEGISRMEAGANFNYVHANAPPGQCGCFSLYGGSGTFVFNLTRIWSGVADITMAHASNVNNSGQNITIINYLFGPRYTRRMYSTRYVPYAQILVGGAKENVNIDFKINRQSFAVLGGGGVTTKLKRRWGLNLIEVDYVYSRIPNAVNNTQNNMRITTGVTYHFGE